MGVEPNYLEVMSLKWFLNIHISGVPICFTPPQISIHIKKSVTPTGLEPVIFTVKGWCPNQLDDSAMSNQCCHRCMATSLICKFLSKYLTILVSSIFPWFSDGQTPESHSNSYQDILDPTYSLFYPEFQHHCPGTFSLHSHTSPHHVDKLHYNLAGWAQHWPTISNVYTLSVGLWN